MSGEDVQDEQLAVAESHAFFSRRAAVYDLFFFKLTPYMSVVRSLFVDRDILTSNMKVLDAGTGTGS